MSSLLDDSDKTNRSRNAGGAVPSSSEENKEGDDDANADVGEENENTEGKVPSLQVKVSQWNKADKAKLEEQEQLDYCLMDALMGFFDQRHDGELLPILCGYFNKIMTSLLNKSKVQFMEYVLKENKGQLFDKLVDNIESHSLSQLLVELLQMSQIYSRTLQGNENENFNLDWDQEENFEGDESKRLKAQKIAPEKQEIEDQLFAK